MKIKAILHADKKWGIGKQNDLMFSLPLDMKFFRTTTKGHSVALGENTLLSFPNSQPLKNRTNIVLSKEHEYSFDNVINVHTFEDFIKVIKEHSLRDDVYIIGGASIYKQMLPYVDEVLLTKVDADGKAEVFFPNLDEDENFKLVYESDPQIDNGYTIRFTTYQNLNKKEIL